MRKTILYQLIIFALYFGFPILLSGQNERVSSSSMDASISYNYLEDLKFHVSFSHTFKQHEPFFGLEVPVSSDPVSNFGLNVGYKFYPNKTRQSFDFFFIYLMQAGSRKLYSNSTTDGFSLQNLIGYGFNVYFNDKIFLKHHIAAGVENAWFGEHGNFNDFSLMISLGIGMKLKSRNAVPVGR